MEHLPWGLTRQPVLEPVNFRVCIAHSLLESNVEGRVLFCKCLVEVLLVVHILGNLVGPEAEGSTGTLHDDVGTQAAQDGRLVFFARAEVRNDGIIVVVEV